MPEIIVALIHLVGTILIGLLILVGLSGVLVCWLIPAIWAHPIATGVIILVIAGLIKARDAAFAPVSFG